MSKNEKLVFGIAAVAVVVLIIALFSSNENMTVKVHNMPMPPHMRMKMHEPQMKMHEPQMKMHEPQMKMHKPRMDAPESDREFELQFSDYSSDDEHSGPEDQKVMVMFFAPWCGHCKNMEPTWDEFTQNFDGYNDTKILKVNGQDNKELTEIHGVRGFPTVKFCPYGIQDPTTIDYQGDRSMQSLVEFLQDNA